MEYNGKNYLNPKRRENFMDSRYGIQADTHCHTVASTHAYGTIGENAAAAGACGLKALAITDHGPALPDAPHPWHFYNMRVLPAEIGGVLILRGAEANILDTAGSLDFGPEDLEALDWVIASLHYHTFRIATPAIHTEALIAAAYNRHVDVLGHPDAPEYPADAEAVVRACRETGTFIEINNSSFAVRKGCEGIIRQFALECMRQGAPVVVNSDAHCPWDIGRIDKAAELLASIDFPEELVFNRDAARLAEHIGRKHGRDVYSRGLA